MDVGPFETWLCGELNTDPRDIDRAGGRRAAAREQRRARAAHVRRRRQGACGRREDRACSRTRGAAPTTARSSTSSTASSSRGPKACASRTPAIYRLAAERVGVEPEACVFVDDVTRNVEGAIAVGMRAIHHTDPDVTIPELEALFGVAAAMTLRGSDRRRRRRRVRRADRADARAHRRAVAHGKRSERAAADGRRDASARPRRRPLADRSRPTSRTCPASDVPSCRTTRRTTSSATAHGSGDGTVADPQRPRGRRPDRPPRALDDLAVRSSHRRRLAVRTRLRRHEGRRRRERSSSWDALRRAGVDARRRPDRPVGRRGGVDGQRHARVRPARLHGRRRDLHRADVRALRQRAGRADLVPRPRRRQPAARVGPRAGRERDREGVRDRSPS